jgi:hypothetical protein
MRYKQFTHRRVFFFNETKNLTKPELTKLKEKQLRDRQEGN